MRSPKFFGLLKKPKPVFVLRRVAGPSMQPALAEGQVVIGYRSKHLAADDIVIFRHDGLDKIKRVAWLDEGQLYVVGDNPECSRDSRHFGMISLSQVVAKVIIPYRRRTLKKSGLSIKN